MTDYTDIDKLREDAYMAGSRALYGTDYMRGEKDRSYRLSRKIIDASGLLAELQGLRTEVDQLRGENERQNQFLLRVHRLSGEVLARPDRTMTVYELNRAING